MQHLGKQSQISLPFLLSESSNVRPSRDTVLLTVVEWPRLYSYLIAATGSIRAARRAGTPARTRQLTQSRELPPPSWTR